MRRLVLVLAFALGCSAPRTPPPAERGEAGRGEAGRGAPGVAAPARDRLFEDTGRWGGADAAYSIAVTRSVSVWFFGDTILDRWTDHAKMPRNTIGIQHGDAIEFSWGPKDADFFPPRTEGTWLWPGDAFVWDGQLTVFLHEFTKEGEGAFGFKRTGSWLARIANPLDAPSAWRITYEKVPWFGPNLYFGVACLSRRATIYVYGALEDPPRRSLVIARLVDGRRWEYLNEDGWGPAPTKPRRLCDGVGAELSVVSIGDEEVWLITTENGLSDKIHRRRAPSAEGPFGPPSVVFTCPDSSWDPSYFCYAAKAHPELRQDDESLVIAYCCNSTDFGKLFKDRRLYRPHFVVVR